LIICITPLMGGLAKSSSCFRGERWLVSEREIGSNLFLNDFGG
jgi:hypothetical protein